MNWKSVTFSVHDEMSRSDAGLHVIRDDGRGTWVPVEPFLQSDSSTSLKDLRRWLWERRACRLLKRGSVCLWGLREDQRTYYGLAVKIDGPLLDRWVAIGGPVI